MGDLIAWPHRCHLLRAKYLLRFVLSMALVCSSDDSELGFSQSCLQRLYVLACILHFLGGKYLEKHVLTFWMRVELHFTLR